MELSEAVDLIKSALEPPQARKIWADLGCGSGLFTNALASLLGTDSTVHAIDRSHQRLPDSFKGNKIVFHLLDFSGVVLPLRKLDGILMANSLHFVKDKVSLLTRLKRSLKQSAQLLIIEYDLDVSNEWVPYPITYYALSELLEEAGFINVSLVGERKSMYGGGKMYACVAVVH